MNLFLHIKSVIDRFVVVLICSCLVIIASLLFIQIILRYFFDNPLSWTDEVSRLCAVWLTFLGSSAVLRYKQHISLDFLPESLSGKPRLFLDVVILCLVGVFSGMMAIYGYSMMIKIWFMHTAALEIPQGIFYIPIFLGGCLLILEAFSQILQEVKFAGDTKPKEDI
jgi:TRAP-type transport system small permease protein